MTFASIGPGIQQGPVKEEAPKDSRHSHKLTRMNLHTCGTCGRFIATTYRETKTGELLIEELELELKVTSSRSSQIHLTTPRKYTYLKQPHDAVMTVEDTCW